MSAARPPRLARALLRRILPPDAREFVVGDLDEEYAERARSGRPVRLWYWSQAIRSMAHVSRQKSSVPAWPRTRQMVPTFIGDVRIAGRALRRAPGFASAATLTLALGIGASIAIFSAVKLRPLPFADPGRLAMMWGSNQERDWHQVHAAPANVEDWRTRVASFSGPGLRPTARSSATVRCRYRSVADARRARSS